MAEDGIPEILAEQRLGHEVPGMRGLYAHASDRMRDELRQALQARWEESLRERAAIHPHSPVPLLNELLSPFKVETAPMGDREKMISQVPPRHSKSPTREARVGPVRRASDLVRDHDLRVELRGFEPLTPSMRTRIGHSNGFWPPSRFPVKYQLEWLMKMPRRVTQNRRMTHCAGDK
jgi:hypothetical protein